MAEVLTDRSPPIIAQAIEANTIEFLLALGRVGGGEERNDAAVQWVIGGSPIAYHNCVVRADLAPDEVDGTIEASVERCRAHDVPGSWHVGPSMRPAQIRGRLTAHGFVAGEEPGMAADLHALHEDVPAPAGLRIERVRDDDALEEWARTLSLGFGEGEREAFWVRDMYRRLGYDDLRVAEAEPPIGGGWETARVEQAPGYRGAAPIGGGWGTARVPQVKDGAWRHYLGRLDGEGVATATLFLAAGVAGIYFVSTAPPFRGRGIGAAITLAPLREARDLDYRIGVLGASSMGYPVYRRLGFDDYCTLGVYEWQASET